MPRSAKDQFPALKALGLKAVDVKGDGNCMFRAISDQLYGCETKHPEVRRKVVKHMRENPNDFMWFLGADFTSKRRNEKRIVRAKGCTEIPSEGSVVEAWECYLDYMSESNYGTQLEIKAFAKAYRMDVRVHLIGTTHGVHGYTSAEDDEKAAPCEVVHLVLANEHYRSVRNINGPHTGPAKAVPHGEKTFQQRLDQYNSGSGQSSSESSSDAFTPATTPPTPARRYYDPGLAFLDSQSDSEDEPVVKKPVQKPVEKKGPGTKPATKPSPAVPSPTMKRTLDFSDGDTDSDDDWYPNKVGHVKRAKV